MSLKVFQDPTVRFSAVLFVQEDDWASKKEEWERLGKQRNVKLVVQPCPFEGIEFLYRIAHDLIGHHVSIDKEIFWQAIELKGDVPDADFGKISEAHHEYLCAILEQDAKRVTKARRALESLARYFR